MDNENAEATPFDPWGESVKKAKKKFSARKLVITGTFRNFLLLGSSALLTLQMLDHLQLIADEKEQDKADTSLLIETITEHRISLLNAVDQCERHDILRVHGDVERMLLSHDPLYLESEDARRTEYMGRKNTPHWLANPSYRFVSWIKGFRGDSVTVTEKEQRSCISICSWSLALIGLSIALAFLVLDFWTAQNNRVESTFLFHEENPKIPTIFACLNIPSIPLFNNFPNANYPGFPLWGLRIYTDSERNESFLHPKTMELVADATYIGNPSKCETQLSYMSLEYIRHGLASRMNLTNRCHSCLRIGSKRPISISFENARNRQAGIIKAEFAISRVLDFCLSTRGRLFRSKLLILFELLVPLRNELLRRGIVEIVGTNPTAGDMEYALWSSFYDLRKKDPRSISISTMEQSIRSLHCNLYLFSGLFFPVKPGTAVRYTFNASAGVDAWKKIGNPSNFLDADYNKWDTNFSGERPVDRKGILDEMRFGIGPSSSVISDNLINIYALSSDANEKPSFSEFAGSLATGPDNVLLFSKMVDDGVVQYYNTMQIREEKLFGIPQRFTRITLSLDYESFETTVVERRPTTSTAEFFTDVFDHIALFTGICAYSLVVSPARLYLKRMKDRK